MEETFNTDIVNGKLINWDKMSIPDFDRKNMEIHICSPLISRITYVYFSSESCCEKLIFFS